MAKGHRNSAINEPRRRESSNRMKRRSIKCYFPTRSTATWWSLVIRNQGWLAAQRSGGGYHPCLRNAKSREATRVSSLPRKGKQAGMPALQRSEYAGPGVDRAYLSSAVIAGCAMSGRAEERRITSALWRPSAVTFRRISPGWVVVCTRASARPLKAFR
jgi:hypothetical protein